VTEYTAEQKLARCRNGLEVAIAERDHYQSCYYELRDKYLALYIKALNMNWRGNYGRELRPKG